MSQDQTKDLFGEIEEYQFQSFTPIPENASQAQEYSFKSFEQSEVLNKSEHQKIIKLERSQAKKNNFNIAPIVREHRGLQAQEEDEREKRIQDEVAKRASLIEEEAFRKGYEDGVKVGREEVYEQTRASTEEKLTSLSAIISDVLKVKGDLLAAQKKEVYKMVRNLTKWVILKELKNDDDYLERLLEKLIVEAQTKSNLLVQVNQKEFEKMEEVLIHLQERIGELPNIRVEVDYDIEGPGIILESDNGIVNGTLSEQFNSLDKLFDVSGLAADDNVELAKTIFEEEKEIIAETPDDSEEETLEASEVISEDESEIVSEHNENPDSNEDDEGESE